MHELLDRITRIPEVRACAVVDVVGGNGALVSWVRDGGDTLPIEAAAADVFEVMSDLLPDGADSPALAATFDSGSRMLARRYGAYFAIVICDATADLVTVRVALQGLALKISLHQRALTLTDPGRASRPSAPAEVAPRSVPSESNQRGSGRASQPNIDPARRAASAPPSAPPARDSNNPARAASSQPGRPPPSSINALKMRDDLVRLFSGELGPLAALLLDEQIETQGGLGDARSVLAVAEALMQHIKLETQRTKVRAEVDKLIRAIPAASVRPPPPPADPAPYRSTPERVDERRVASMAQLFIEFVGPIGKLVFDEEVAAHRTGAVLLRPQARTLLQSLSQHVPASSRRSFIDRAEKLLGSG